MTTEVIYLSNDNLLIVDAVQDSSDDSYINDATVTCTLKDLDGNAVTGQTFPLTLAYVSGSNGKYQGKLEDGLSLTARQAYIAHIDIDAGSDLLANIQLPVVAKTRT